MSLLFGDGVALALATAAAAAGFFCACFAFALAFVTGAQAQDRLKAVTSFTILADMARNVAGDAADVVSITKPGAEIHNYQPTPGDLVAAQDADLILWNGLNLEQWFAQFLDNLPDVPSVVESGHRKLVLDNFFGLSGPPKMPADVVTRLNTATNEILASADFKRRMVDLGIATSPVSQPAFAGFVKEQVAQLAPTVKGAGVRL